MEQYNQMLREGFYEYITDEMNRLKSDLSYIRSNLVHNPVEARDISYNVGSYISSMFSVGRAAIQQYEINERMKRAELAQEIKENSSELLKVYYDAIQCIKDPITRNFARPRLELLKNKIVDEMQITTNDLQSVKKNICNQVKNVTEIAEAKAKEWKNQKKQENTKKDLLSQVDNLQQDVTSEVIENEKNIEELLDQIKKLRIEVESGDLNVDKLQSSIKKVNEEIDNIAVSESVRKETVKAIVKSLQSQEFSVDTPTILENQNGKFVRIVAKKPSGRRAECRIDLHGKIKYKFDSYEGMTCLKDIEKFNVDLEKVYSIKLSDERVLWENPNRISKEEKQIVNDIRRNI